MATLKDELVNDPLGRQYAQMSIEQMLADLTEARYPAEFVGIPEVNAYLDTNLLRPGLRRAMGDEALPQMVRDVVETTLDFYNARYPAISVAVAAPLVDTLIEAGVWAAEHKTGLLALADNKRNRCDILGISIPSLADLRVAMEEAGLWPA